MGLKSPQNATDVLLVAQYDSRLENLIEVIWRLSEASRSYSVENVVMFGERQRAVVVDIGANRERPFLIDGT